MLLKITHTTILNYSDLISESVMELRVAPRQEQDQHRLSFSLAIGPATTVNSYFDWLDNTVHAFTISPLHSQIQIVATSVVETDRQPPDPPKIADVWPFQSASPEYGLFDFLQFGGPIVDSRELRELVKLLYVGPTLPLGEIAIRMVQLINNKFAYEQGITTAASPITEILTHHRGVCQDFTHLMIGMARALGIPARYVSGLVHPDAERFRGYSQTHAWCELYFPSEGWIGFDPTNNCVVGSNFVKVAIGRDYRDVPPNKGMYRGHAQETIDVRVTSAELLSIPPELAAERIQSLPVPVYPAGFTMTAELAALHQQFVQQQQQQQQQQQS